MVDAIESLLPQTQCGKCKHPGCHPYAEAIVRGESINHCVPGGQDTINALAELLGEAAIPLDPSYGTTPAFRQVAVIREDECIGCTKCIQACPLDAIVGAAKFTHTIISDECTGCDLCIAPCPVDCIDLVNLPDEPLLTKPADRQAQAAHQKARYEFRNNRLADAKASRQTRRDTSESSEADTFVIAKKDNDKSTIIAAALARSNLKKAERSLTKAQENGEDTTLIQQEIDALLRKLQSLQP